MAALPKSPATGRRRSSSGGGLRPVIPFGLDDGTAVQEEAEDEEEEIGPIQHSGPSVDEVEYAYGLVSAFHITQTAALMKPTACEEEALAMFVIRNLFGHYVWIPREG